MPASSPSTVRRAAVRRHGRGPSPEPTPASRSRRHRLGARVAGALDFLRRRLTGDYEVDEFGFDAELNDAVLMAPLRPLFQRWFRVEVTGLENVPGDGPAPDRRQPLRDDRRSTR